MQRKPHDFATTQAAGMKSGWGFMLLGATPWQDLLDALTRYAALREDQHAARTDALQRLPGLITAWEVHHKVGTATLSDDEKAKVAALQTLRGLIASEHRELAGGGAQVNEATQGVKALRFKGDYMLEQVFGGHATLVKGDSGLYVTKVQQALSDASHLGADKVTGTFDDDTVAGVKAFQRASAAAETGIVDRSTFAALETIFRTHATERRLAAAPGVGQKAASGEFAWGSAPAALTAGTRVLGGGDETAAKQAVKTSLGPGAGGVLPTFKSSIPGKGSYEARLEALVLKLVDLEYQYLGKGKAGKRNPGDLYDWAQIETVAARSKTETDAVFGKFAIGPPLVHGAGLHDAWDTKVLALSTVPAQDSAAAWRVDKLLTGNSTVKALDREHGAIQSRGPEKGIVDKVRTAVVLAKRAELLETHKGWPAFASGGEVNLQRFKEATDPKNRDAMWDLFQTVVHEYLHTLEHSRHKGYQGKLGQQEGSFTLREGVTEYFTHTVLEGVNYDAGLRTLVEGPWHQNGVTHPIPDYVGYGERAQAERLAGVVGARNVMAAFFLGDIEKIGGKP